MKKNNYFDKFEDIKNIVFKSISRQEFDHDKVGFTIILYFLLKNRIKGKEITDLKTFIKSNMNEIAQKKYTRFIDQDITSALFGHYLFKKFGILHKKPDFSSVIEELKKHQSEEGSFFKNNTLFTTLINLSLIELRVDLKREASIKWLKEKLLKNTNGNSKVIYFFFRLLTSSKDSARSIYPKNVFNDYQSEQFDDIDRIHICNLIWENRGLFNKKEIKDIKKECLSVIEYGYENLISKKDNPKEISKINSGAYLNLVKSFFNDVIVMSEEEVTSRDIFPRVLGLALIFLIIYILYNLFIILQNYNILSEIIIKKFFDIFNFRILLNIFIIFLFCNIAIFLISIFIDTVFKGITEGRRILHNFYLRFKNWIIFPILSSIIIEVIKIFIHS